MFLIRARIILQRVTAHTLHNAQNTAGWQVFYATAVAMVALVLSAVLLIIASFLHPKADA